MTMYKLSGFEATVLIINLLCCKLFLLTPLIFARKYIRIYNRSILSYDNTAGILIKIKIFKKG